MSDQPRPDGRTAKGTFSKGVSGNPRGVAKDAPQSEARTDGWASALSGIGTAENDKRTSHTFISAALTYEQAVELWRGDDLAARAIESVPNECFRCGYEITISDEGKFDDLKEQIEEGMQRIGADAAVKRAIALERGLGGSAILMGTNDNRKMSEPLDVKSVKRLDWLNVLEPCEIEPASYYGNPLKPKYGEVEYYRLTGRQPYSIYSPTAQVPKKLPKTADMTKVIHETRLIVFSGIQVSRYQMTNGLSGSLWGDSILTRVIEILRDFNVAMHAAGIIVTDFSQAVFKIQNLMTLVARDPDKLRARMQALEMARSVARAVLVDTTEEFERQSTNVSGLPEMLQQLSKRLAAAIGIPLELLLGEVGEKENTSVARFYYDYIQGYQRERVGPVLKQLATMIMQGLRERKRPTKWGIRFHPLWRLTDEEQANARLAQARVDSIYIKMGVLDPDEVRTTRFGGEYSFETQIDEDKKAPGFVTLPPTGVGPEEAAKLTAPPGVGATAHAVKPYNRSNPKTSGNNNAETENPGGGGDSPPADNRDEKDPPEGED